MVSEPRLCQFCWQKGRTVAAGYEVDEDLYCPACLREAGYVPADAAPVSQMERKDADMEFKKHCACGKGIRGPHDQCRKCRLKTGRTTAQPAKPRQKKANGPVPPETVTVRMNVSWLDQWWSGLTPQEKADLFSGVQAL